MADARKVSVLIIGGGPIGLAVAVELAWRGIPCELIEQTDGSIKTPKMNEVNTRTMEFCRRWGVADAVINCPFPKDYPQDVVFVTNLAGYELARAHRPSRANAEPEFYGPMRRQACSQIWFDPILRNFAASQPGVTLRYRHRLESFEQTPSGVIAEIVSLESNSRERLFAEYLVACDGANSAVRDQLGIGLAGKGTLGYPAHLFFRAPGLLKSCGKDPGTFFFVLDKGGLWANLRVTDPANDTWRLMVLETDGKQTPESLDRESMLRRVVGKSIDVEWLGASVWTRRSLVAECYSKDRVFLAGDAVHQLSPTGALGMNTGMGDAVDLGWKLAATLQGWGGSNLLASYDTERRPIGMRNVGMATQYYFAHATLSDISSIEDETEEGQQLRSRLSQTLPRDLGRMSRSLGLEIGYHYDRSPICIPDGTPAPADDADNYVPSARPGARAPHCWLADGRSSLDLFGQGFTLLRLGAAAPASDAFVEAAASRKVPLRTVQLNEPEAADLYQTQLALVRPDGHVAWRGDRLPADAVAAVDHVRGA